MLKDRISRLLGINTSNSEEIETWEYLKIIDEAASEENIEEEVSDEGDVDVWERLPKLW